LNIEPDFLEDVSHEHDDGISSFVYRHHKPFNAAKILAFMHIMIGEFGNDLLPYKGILYISGTKERLIYQGVHMLITETLGTTWQAR